MTGPRIEGGHWVFPEKPAPRPKRRKAKRRPRELSQVERQAAIERQPGIVYGPDARPRPQRGPRFEPGSSSYERLRRKLEETAVQPADPTRTQYRRRVKRE